MWNCTACGTTSILVPDFCPHCRALRKDSDAALVAVVDAENVSQAEEPKYSEWGKPRKPDITA